MYGKIHATIVILQLCTVLTTFMNFPMFIHFQREGSTIKETDQKLDGIDKVRNPADI